MGDLVQRLLSALLAGSENPKMAASRVSPAQFLPFGSRERYLIPHIETEEVKAPLRDDRVSHLPGEQCFWQ